MLDKFYKNLKSLSPIIIVFWLLVWGGFSAIIGDKLLNSDVLINNSVAVWFNSEDPEIKKYEDYNRIFGDKEWTILVLKTASIYNLDFLHTVDNITTALEALEHVVKVTSISNVRDNFITEDGSIEYNVLYADHPTTLKEKLHRNNIFIDNLIKADSDQVTAILIQNDNFIYDQSFYRIDLVNNIADIMVQHAISVDNYALSGTTVVNAELNKAAIRDTFVFYSLVTVLLTFICLLVLKSLKDLVIVLSVVLSSVLPAMGILAYLNIPYNMATIMLPTILVGLSIAAALHFITDFHVENTKLGNADEAVRLTLNKLFKPVFGTTLTTLIGFTSFSLSNVEPVYQLGMCAALGLFVSWLAMISLIPLLLRWMWRNSVKKSKGVLAINNTGFIFTHPKLILSGAVLLLLSIIGLKDVRVDTNYALFFSESTKISQDYAMINDVGFSQNPIIISIDFNNAAGLYQNWSTLLNFEKDLRKLVEVKKILTFSDFILQLDKAFNNQHHSNHQIAHYNGEQLSQLLLLGELSGNDDLTDFIDDSKQHSQIVVLTDYMSSIELLKFKQQIIDLQALHFPENIKINVTGTTSLWANMDENVSHTQLISLVWVALGMIVLLPLIIGSKKLAVIALFINFIPLAVTLSIMAWLGISLNMATALIGAISIGIVVDDTIHFMTRIRANEKTGMGSIEAIQSALQTTGTSILRTSIIVAVTFLCMATSSFLPSAHFGLFLTLSVGIALFLDVFVAPNLLLHLAKKQHVNSNKKNSVLNKT